MKIVEIFGRKFKITGRKVTFCGSPIYNSELKKLFAAVADALGYDVDGIRPPQEPFTLGWILWGVSPVACATSMEHDYCWDSPKGKISIGCKKPNKKELKLLFTILAKHLKYEIVG